MRYADKTGKEWDVADRLAFLWLSTVAIKNHTDGLEFNPIHDSGVFDEALTSPHAMCRPFEDEARDIGRLLADSGFRKMTDTLDEIEGIHGLNAGEWVARRWDGIMVQGDAWVS